MSAVLPDCFVRLGLDATTADERSVKRAYAAALKLVDLRTDPERFAELRQTYEAALLMVRHGAWPFTPAVEVHAPATEREPEGAACPAGPPIDSHVDEPAPMATPASTAPPAPAPALVVFEHSAPSEPDIDALFQSLAASRDKSQATQILRDALATSEFDSLSARDAMQTRLVDGILQRRFGLSNGAVLMAAAEMFNWHAGGQLQRMGIWGARLSAVLDEVAVIDRDRLARWLVLTGEPEPKMALELLSPEDAPGREFPLLASVLFDDTHIHRWREARKRAPWHLRAKAAMRALRIQGMRSMPARVATGLALVSLAVLAFNVIFSVAHVKELRLASAECDRAYARAIGKDWRGISLQESALLERCSAVVPPARCDDRTQLGDLLGVASRLHGQAGRLYFFDDNAVHIQMPDGRSFGVAPEIKCDWVWRFAQGTNWLAQGDVKAAYQFVADLAKCPVPAEDDKRLLRTLLMNTDAWPADMGRAKAQRANLEAMVSAKATTGDSLPNASSNALARLPQNRVIAACVFSPTETDLSAIGPMEAAAIMQSTTGMPPS